MRSLLFVPADSERKIARGLASGADVVILDLEDSVAAANKPAARRLTAEVLTRQRAKWPMLIVRVNALGSGLIEADLEAVMPASPDGLMQPKTRGAEDVKALAAMAGGSGAGGSGAGGSGAGGSGAGGGGAGGAGLAILAIATETAGALFGIETYADAVPPLVGLTWGAEDLSNDLGAQASRDEEGRLSDPYRFARTLCLIGARAANVEPIDTVYVNYRDGEGLQAECRAAARDGFTGKMAIHPDQVEPINRLFTPAPEAVDRARRIIEAFKAAGDAGVVGFHGEMLDRPHLARAEQLLARATRYGGSTAS
jgi:citrate lyase subunit beta / citryl-CoA lyase